MSRKRFAVFLAFVVIAAAAAGYCAFLLISRKNNEEAYEAIRQTAEASQEPQSEETSSQAAAESEKPVIPIDFAVLQAKNPDIYAWITIPDTAVDYPLVQSAADNSYYLNHTVEGASGYPGSIYTESCSGKDFSGFGTIIYGHDMRDGSMFGGLRQYRDPSYLDAHRDIVIYTPTEILNYRIFAAVVYSDAYLPQKFNFTLESGRSAFLDSILNNRDLNSQVLTDIPVDTSSRIITLSTCIGSQPDNRYLIEAVYVN